MTTMYQPPTTFGQLQQQGQARPPSPTPVLKAGAAPQPGGMPQINGQPNISQAWQGMFGGAQQPSFGGGPQANYQPGGYRPQGNFAAYSGANFKVPTMQSNQQGPQVQQLGQFQNPQGGQQVDQRTLQAIMESLGNPSRYGSAEAGKTFDLLDHRLTQQGNADKQRIDEDMARRGIYASTTAGGRLGDLATNLNQQRADFGTSIALDQAKNYQGDRASAIGQAMGYGGQQFGQGLAGFEANQGAGQQRFGQELARGQFGLGQTAQNFGQGLAASQFGLQQNNQNFGQQAQQYGLNQQESMNRFNAGMGQAQFGLQQNNQNFGQAFDRFGANQAANQQGFNQQQQALGGLQQFGQQGWQNQYDTAQFNANQQNIYTQQLLQQLGML